MAGEKQNLGTWTAGGSSGTQTATSFLSATSPTTLMRANSKTSSWVCFLEKQHVVQVLYKLLWVEHILLKSELFFFLSAYGNVVELRINTKGVGGKLPNFGFVVFDDSDPVQRILGAKVHGTCIYISLPTFITWWWFGDFSINPTNRHLLKYFSFLFSSLNQALKWLSGILISVEKIQGSFVWWAQICNMPVWRLRQDITGMRQDFIFETVFVFVCRWTASFIYWIEQSNTLFFMLSCENVEPIWYLIVQLFIYFFALEQKINKNMENMLKLMASL